jgi:outer membrane protein OmpA-like peptidoglycan-associated protein
MRNCITFTLLSALTVTGWAQQNAVNSTSTAPASTTSATSDREPLASPRPKDFWDGDDPNLVNLIEHPFATKRYVQKLVSPIRDRVNELEQITSENAGHIKDVDSRAQQGIQLASSKTSLADEHANDAASKAQLAETAANTASSRVGAVERTVSNLDQYKGTAQTEIRFHPGQTVLSKTAKDALDQMADPLKGQQSYIIEVRGFAPGQGLAAIRSSQRMADSVVRYLVLTHNIPLYRIYAMSMGNAGPNGEKRATAARVEVNVLKNDLGTSAQR